MASIFFRYVGNMFRMIRSKLPGSTCDQDIPPPMIDRKAVVRKLATIEPGPREFRIDSWYKFVKDVGLTDNHDYMLGQFTTVYNPSTCDKTMWDVYYTYQMIVTGVINKKFQLNMKVLHFLKIYLNKCLENWTEENITKMFDFVKDNVSMLDLMAAGL